MAVLSSAEHFSYSFLHALSFEAHYLNHLLVLIVIVAIKLGEYTNLYATLKEFEFTFGCSEDKTQQLEVVLRFVIYRDNYELAENHIKLRELAGFADVAAAAFAAVRGQAEEERQARKREKVLKNAMKSSVKSSRESLNHITESSRETFSHLAEASRSVRSSFFAGITSVFKGPSSPASPGTDSEDMSPNDAKTSNK